MECIRFFLVGVFLSFAFGVRAQDGATLLARAERRADVIDSVNHLFSGGFRQVVVSNSHFGEDTVHSIDTFAVKVGGGIQEDRQSISETPAKTGVRMPPNSGSVFAIRNALFPFRAKTDPSKVDVRIRRLADTTIVNRLCGVLAYDYHLKADSTTARGAGRLWIALDDATPLISAYELGGHHPRRGDFLSSVVIRTMPFGPGAVIVRNDTKVQFSLHGKDIGIEETTVVNSNFLAK